MAATCAHDSPVPCEDFPVVFMSMISHLTPEQVRALCWKDYNFELGQLTVPADVWGKKLDLVICFSIWKQQWLKNHYLAQTGQLGRAPRQGERMFPEASQN